MMLTTALLNTFFLFLGIVWAGNGSITAPEQHQDVNTEILELKQAYLRQQSIIEDMKRKLEDQEKANKRLEVKYYQLQRSEEEMNLQAERMKELENSLLNLKRLCNRTLSNVRDGDSNLQTSVNLPPLLNRTANGEIDSQCNNIEKRTSEHITPNHVAFSVGLNTSLSNLGENSTVIFDYVLFNTLNAYEQRTGIFTAPVDGVYVFISSILNLNGTLMNSAIYLNSKLEARMLSNAEHSKDAASSSNAIVIQVKQGDQITVKTGPVRYHTGDIYGRFYSTFSGWRLF